MRIEIHEGPPSRYNNEANCYVIAIPDEGKPRLLGGPMTEDNALGMIDELRKEEGIKLEQHLRESLVQAPAQQGVVWAPIVFLLLLLGTFVIPLILHLL